MEIFTLLETLEDILENSKGLPFTNKTMVDKEELLEIIKEIRIKLPDELKQAKWVKEERQRILAEAQKEADGIVKEAENRIISMIDEHEITRKAYEMSREISQGTKEYANNLLNSTEKVLTDSLAKLEKDISEAANIMQMSLEGTIKTIQDSKKELQ